MPVSVNPIRDDSQERNSALLATALNLAKDVFRVKMDEKQFNKAQELAGAKRQEELDIDQQKQAVDFAKDFEIVDPSKPGAIDPKTAGIRLPRGINLPDGSAIRPRSVTTQESTLAAAEKAKDADRLNQRIIAGINASAKKDTADNKPTTEGERLTAVYGQRLEQANSILGALEQDPQAGLTNWDTAIAKQLPNSMQGATTQKFEQAKRNFLNAALRKESGASISPDERESGDLQYFPQYGDSQETLAQKAANRQLVIDGFKVASGKAWGNLDTAVANSKGPQENSVVTLPSGAKVSREQILDELRRRQMGTVSK